MLSDAEISALEDILFAPPWGEESLDFFGLHGVVAASVVGPTRLTVESLFRLTTGADDVQAQDIPDTFRSAVEKLSVEMAKALDLGQSLELPEPEDGDPMNALENWCAGFVDTFLENEDEWLEPAEEEAADLMVPILTLSGLFDDADFQKVKTDEKLSRQMIDAIPDALTDLYLLYHSPD